MKFPSDLNYSEIRQLRKSEIWRIVEAEEVALEELEVFINTTWANAQKERTSVNRDWENAKAEIQWSRKAYKAEIEAVDMMRIDAKERRDQIRMLKNDIYTNNIGDMK